MNNITKITKRDIFELFIKGYTETNFFDGEEQQINYSYYGRLEEIDFLEKLYPIDEMPSNDDCFENTRYDIIQHTINNDDWGFGWVFADDRFGLLHGGDTKILEFICAVFHPENRKENGYWKQFLDKINTLLMQDGYELYEETKISGKSVYSYRQLSPEEIASKKFIPYSIRYKKMANNSLSISKNIRKEIYTLFEKHNEIQYRTTETNFGYEITSIEAIMGDIKEHYIPKAFMSDKTYSETNDLKTFVIDNYPYNVFDAIELFARYNINTFPDEINLIFQQNNFPFKLLGGKIERTSPIIKTNEIIKEEGLKELIDHASLLYGSKNTSDKQLAVEKLWDAFERLKTYYGAGDQKKSSIGKIIAVVSSGNDNFKGLFDEEFNKLTKIGNDYRIRHHEMNKIDIIDQNYYDYLFQRCFALIDLVLKYLK